LQRTRHRYHDGERQPRQPAAAYALAHEVTQENFGSVPRAYIECSLDRSVPLAQQQRFQREVPGAAVRRMETSHSPFFSWPGELADVIIELTETD